MHGHTEVSSIHDVAVGRPGALRFAVLCGPTLRAWQAECIARLCASGLATPALLIRMTEQPSRRAHPGGGVLYQWYEARWVRPRVRAFQARDPRELMADTEYLEYPESPSESAVLTQHVERIRQHALDFILDFADGDLPDELRGLARHGVWSFRQDGERVAAGHAAGFWSLVRRQPTTEVVVEQLNGACPAASVLYRAVFAACRASWTNNLDRALLASADACVRVCAELVSSGKLPALPPADAPANAARAPTNLDLLRFALSAARYLLARLYELMFHLEIWNVGFSTQSVQEVLRAGGLDAARVSWCKPHLPGHFIADPFAYELNGEPRVLVEDCRLPDKGRICALALPCDVTGPELTVEFVLPTHLSYPYIFQDQGETYCIPEMFQSNRVQLFKLQGQSWNWKPVRTLIEGQPIVDPTLFTHAGRYWLFCTHADDGAGGTQKLYAYHADRLDAEWRPHRLNPLVSDIGSARPAGRPVEMDGELYRPSQDCSTTYGAAVVFNKILKLSPDEFEEVRVATIRPLGESPYPAGLHTINPMGTGSIFDGKRFVFDWLAWVTNQRRLRRELFL